MKAVFITNIPAPYQIKFCSVLKEYGDITYIFCNSKNADRPDHWKMQLESNCIILDEKKKFVFGQERYINFDIWSVLSRLNPDIVIVGGFAAPTNMIAYIWSKVNKKKYVVFSEISRNPANLKIYKMIYKSIDSFLLCGQAAIQQFSEVFNQKIYNFPYPADLENKLAIERVYKRTNIKFLYASRFVEEFNPLLCIEAFAKLRRKHNDITLLMSSTGELLEQCIVLTKELGVSDAVEFRLKLENWEAVNNLFADADVLLYPARFAGWGLVVPEAMAAGMPVITTRGVGASDLLPNDQIIRCDETELIQQMEDYILHPDKIELYGKRNREICRTECFDEKAKLFVGYLNAIFEGGINS